MKKNIWKILLGFGLLPFIIVIAYGIYASITGFSGICILGCSYEYGFIAFLDSVLLFSYVFWPAYIIGAVLILLAIIKLRNR